MKNLLTYVHPRKDFDEEHKILAKIQIDNSLDLGWQKEDILLVTNFPYEYKGVRALVIEKDTYCVHSYNSTKTVTTQLLFQKGLIEKGQLYWLHDFDAFQLEPITEAELGVKEFGLTDYGRMPRLNFGSLFFRESAGDLFNLIIETMYRFQTNDESALMVILTDNSLWADKPSTSIGSSFIPAGIGRGKEVEGRVQKLNITYDFILYNLRSCYKLALKPLRVAHFHIFPRPMNPANPRPDALDFFIRGKNKLGIKLLPERILKIFSSYGVV